MCFHYRPNAFLLSTTAAVLVCGAAVTGAAEAQQAAVTTVSASASELQATSGSFKAPSAGIYVFRVPAVAGATLTVDGNVLLSVPTTIAGQDVSVYATLTAGDHDVSIEGLSASDGTVTVEQRGGNILLNAAATNSIASIDGTLARPSSTPSTTTVAPLTPIVMSPTTTPDPVPTPDPAPAPVTPVAVQPDTPTPTVTPRTGALSDTLDRLNQTGGARQATGVVRSGRSGGLADVLSSVPNMTGAAVVTAPLAPPASAGSATGIQMTYAGDSYGRVPSTGVTLFGMVGADVLYDEVEVTISPSGRTTTVSVSPETGQFAVRLFEEDLDRSLVTVTAIGVMSSDGDMRSQPVTSTIRPNEANTGVVQAMSRMTFGPTPALHAKLRGMTFEQFVDEQLNPDDINDRAVRDFAGDLLTRSADNNTNYMRNWQMHEIAQAAYSERQLQEVMGRFWFNHFHAKTKSTGVYYNMVEDRVFFRENAFGNFEDLLLYSARSPLMSQYLDNDESRAGAINENYGREILELHTLGVTAGYTLDDIIATARVFTGWDYERTVDPDGRPQSEERYVFQFVENRHDIEDKVFPYFGTTIAGIDGPEGVQEGEQLIAMLANDPATRSNVCTKMVQLLASDMPPASLVDACTASWEETSGEIEPMLRAVLLHPDYLTHEAVVGTKVKTPFEYVVSAVRALNLKPNDEGRDTFLRRLLDAHIDAGENSATFAAPTGLPEVGAAWTNSATFIALYRELVEIFENTNNHGLGNDITSLISDEGLASAEEVAAYLLIGSGHSYTQVEFDAVVGELLGDDGIFDPVGRDESSAIKSAMTAVLVQPSFHIQ